ncbi:MAG: S24 family peptidase [Candidatus Moraniibacteriota bacterium]
MHKNQEKLLKLSKTHDLGRMSYREIASLLGEKNAQTAKYHLLQLQMKGLIKMSKGENIIERVKQGVAQMSGLVAIPVYGAADCGGPTKFAENYIQSFIRVSSTLVPYKKGLFAVQADGFSMNNARIGKSKRNIDPGDYVIVDGDVKVPEKGEYVLSVIDGLANIKKFYLDEENRQVMLVSESTMDYPPIVIDESEIDQYVVSGKVVEVIKNVKN